MTNKYRPSLVAPLVLLLVIPSLARAWGGDGHRVVARVAELRISEASKAAIHELLGASTLVDVATWADDVREQRRKTGPWHFVDIPFDAPGYDPTRDGKSGDNVVDALWRSYAAVADRSRPPLERAEGLKFLVHFVGDLHQPLHCAERNGDRGGNARLVFFMNRQRALNLHQVWDSELVDQAMKGGGSLSVYAAALNARVTPAEAAAWTRTGPAEWAGEAHQLAVTRVYAGIPADGPPPHIDRAYIDASTPVVADQLRVAGVRLAAVIDRALAGEPMAVPPGAAGPEVTLSPPPAAAPVGTTGVPLWAPTHKNWLNSPVVFVGVIVLAAVGAAIAARYLRR